MNNIRISTLFSILIMSYLGCTKAIIDEGTGEPINKIIKFDPDVQAITFNHCTTCHGGAAPSAGILLTDYQNVRFYTESGNLLSRMNDAANPMPPSGLLTPQQRQIIDKWIEDGYLEN